jgi:hypothetical protein
MHAAIFSNEDLLERSASGGEPGAPEPDSDPDALKKFLSKLDPEDLGKFQP